MTREHVDLSGDKQTLLITLYGKALDSRAEQPILGDTFARDVVDHLYVDFAKLHVPRGAEVSLPVRARENGTAPFAHSGVHTLPSAVYFTSYTQMSSFGAGSVDAPSIRSDNVLPFETSPVSVAPTQLPPETGLVPSKP